MISVWKPLGKSNTIEVLTLSFTADPDLTNPTRHRWESPLETIRGFEAAIDRDEHRGSYVGILYHFLVVSMWRVQTVAKTFWQRELRLMLALVIRRIQ